MVCCKKCACIVGEGCSTCDVFQIENGYVFVFERESEGERERDRQTDRQTDREGGREKEKQREGDRQTDWLGIT